MLNNLIRALKLLRENFAIAAEKTKLFNVELERQEQALKEEEND